MRFVKPEWLLNPQARSLLAEGLVHILENPSIRPKTLQLLGLDYPKYIVPKSKI